ncbi:meiosis regulator and mRNA stability factor 1 isoform X2 [Hypomesus transpacificus]|uniref:meiosis regulator and mRNA stability factor 1 isoform X2 n=1 Tax=Hypomesus transpacificus TaxID=137520 RepID=UPI001F07F3E9|nr:meiosis regulator and mRNA stability factor 1 isoform X2 [Hypomesus transpacificus]
MDGLGKERPICSSRPFPWLSQPETETSSRLWNLTDCFSTYDKNTPYSDKQKEYMDTRKPVLELKDVPPPPHHTSSSKPFPLAQLPLPPPCLIPPPVPPQQQDSLQQQQQQQGASPKVSACTHCEGSLQHYSTTGGYGLVTGGGSCVGASGVSLYMPPCTQEPPSISSSMTGASAMTSALHFPSRGGGGGGDALNALRGSGSYKLNLPSVATSQPLPSHPYTHLPCCTAGLLRPLHPYPSTPVPYSQASLLPPPSAPLVAPLHSSCLASSSYYPCSSGYSPAARGSQRAGAGQCDHHSPASSHLCSNPMHLSVERTVCLKGAHYCQGCLTKPVRGVASEPDQAWPGVAPPQSAPIPICNGCGTSSDGLLLLGTSLGKAATKYGSPDGPENVPPVGVFWDIENCCVPTGRSAAAVVHRMRARFFQGHREAEFMCVCDISKENKAVIQELNNCQVTVAHINATAKNAADDKLRQSLRRFAETHAAPATVVLVSSDVNFASELSDLRHRHGFQVILVHNTEASPALLQHAHRHVTFQDITADLPPRMVVKSQPSLNLLYVYNLPTNRDGKSVSARLRRLSDNCGGKVLGVSSGTAVIRFGSQDAAERARKRMENEDVYGRRISLALSPRPPGFGTGGGGGGDVPPVATPPPASAVPHPPSTASPFSFLPLEKPRSPRRSRRTARLPLAPATVPERPYSPRRGCSGPPASGSPAPARSLQEASVGLDQAKLKTGFHPEKGRCSSSPHGNGDALQPPSLPPKASLVGESMYRRRGSTPRSRANSPADRATDRGSGEFQVSTPSAFSKLSLHRTFSPLLLSQGSWSSRSASPCLSSRSSPLLGPPRSPLPDGLPQPFVDGADVQVANLDYRMSRKELQQLLRDTFSRHGMVKGVELSPHTDYQLKATVQMGSLQQAICAVSGLHRYKIGGKRIHVLLVTGGNNKSLAMLSSEIISILQDAPACCLPLFKFTEIYEKKYSRKLAVSDLYRLSETVAVREQGGSRLVCLLPSSQARQSPLGSSQSQEGCSSSSASPVVFEELEYHEPVCRHHHTQDGFSEADFDPDSYQIPFVVVSIKALSSQVHSLLQSHEGTLPLLSFPDCYASEFSPLHLAEEGQLESGVPLEHLITCVPGITIVTAQNGFKIIKWIHNKPPVPNADLWVQRCKSPVGNPQLIQFSREVIDLMKGRPFCVMPVSKFIPAYHHHFAKQCRVSDYGYSKLLELLEAVPHVLQILGMGTKRLLTLTHRAQVKRFTHDLLKLLKFQASKQVVIRDFMQAYHWCFSRDWHVTDYGMCDLMDLLAEIPDTTVTVIHQDSDTVISVPKRERTAEEVERTRQFGKEVVDLLRHQPHCRMPFSKFIPTYHHHFGRQCKLTYYGFSKLLELFEAIPDVLTVLECGEEKLLTLTELERVKALAAQLVKLLRAQPDSGLPASQLLAEYSKTYGYGLRLQDYDVGSLPALLAKLGHVVKVVDGAGGREVQLINRKSLRSLTCQLLALLMALGEGECASVSVDELSDLYLRAHATALNPCEYGFLSLSELLKSLPYLVELFHEEEGEDGGRQGGERVRLTRLYQFARGVRAMLHTYHYHQIFLTEFPGAYGKFTGRNLQPRAYGYSTIDELLGAIPQVVWIKGHGHKRIIVLKNDMKARVSSTASTSPQQEEEEGEEGQRYSPCSNHQSGTPSPAGMAGEAELLCLASPVDLLCGPVPSCLPSPQLRPDPVLLRQADLIHFGEQTPPPPTPPPSEDDGPEGSADEVDPPSRVCDQPPKPEPPPAVCGQPEDAAAAPKPPKAPAHIHTSVDSPSKRAPRNKVRLAANFSFSVAP